MTREKCHGCERRVVTILFTLSLLPPGFCSNFCKAPRGITKKEYQMGGAAAGFLIIYGALHASYSSLAKSALDDSRHQLAVCRQHKNHRR